MQKCALGKVQESKTKTFWVAKWGGGKRKLLQLHAVCQCVRVCVCVLGGVAYALVGELGVSVWSAS